MLLTTDWASEFGLPQDLIKSGLCGSGIFDLKSMRLSARSSYVHLADESEQALSAQRHIARFNAPLIVAYGTLETPEIQRQSCGFALAVADAGKPVQLLVAEGLNHLKIIKALAHTESLLGRGTLAQMGLIA